MFLKVFYITKTIDYNVLEVVLDNLYSLDSFQIVSYVSIIY